ncbi:ABC transporter substrate-binding protein [Kitasatospora sp. NPDC059146]|uniref:ABC transporter substrate-binding protein n=1 Tax=unclassified Kitasatospora TaxID=2633591 RepID=UPI0036CAD8EE
MRIPLIARAAAAATAAVLLAAGCGSSSGGTGAANGSHGLNPPKLPMLQSLGAGEGQVNLVAWAGYAEDGSDDKGVDWVHPFEQQTGCKVNAKIAGTSDEMVSLMKTGQYDAVSASGDATLRLIAAGDVAPVNTALVQNYADVFDGLKNQPWNSVNGQMYGIPHGRGANLLMYRTDKVTPAPDSWSVVFDGAAPYAGHVTAYDSPIYIADAALYLMKTKPELGITNPYALDATQLKASVDLLKTQHKAIGEYWSDFQKSENSFKTGDTVVGTSWQVIANLAQADKAPVKAVLPKEGATGWSDTWMVSAKAAHPNCAYQWMNWIVSPTANAQVAQWFGEAPANSKACDLTTDKGFCTTFHAADEAYWKDVYYWTTPVKSCLDGRTVACTDYAAWTSAWTEIKG